MNLQRDGDRLVLVVEARHLRTAGIGVGVVVLALGLGLGGRTMRAARAAASADSLAWAAAPRFDVAVTGRPFKGSPDAPVTIVEFSDFQCPFCVQAFRDLRLGHDVRERLDTGKSLGDASPRSAASPTRNTTKNWAPRLLCFGDIRTVSFHGFAQMSGRQFDDPRQASVSQVEGHAEYPPDLLIDRRHCPNSNRASN